MSETDPRSTAPAASPPWARMSGYGAVGLYMASRAWHHFSTDQSEWRIGFSAALAAYFLGVAVAAWRRYAATVRDAEEEEVGESADNGMGDDAADDGDKPLRSLVFLLDEPREISGGAWIGHLGEALGVRLDGPDDLATSFVMPMPHPTVTVRGDDCFMLKIPCGVFWIFHVKRPYVDDLEEYAARIEDKRLREAFAGHQAWISVDLLTWLDGPEEEERIYAVIGKALAALAGPDVRAIFAPDLQRANEFDPMLLPVLSGGKPLSLFDGPTFAPVLQASRNDEQMEAAIDEARRRWPEFVALFEKRDPDSERPWLVKAPFGSGEDTEHMWVLVSALHDDTIHGTLSNQPHHLTHYHEGQEVTTPVATLTDWLCADEQDKPLGGWSQKVLNAQRPRRPKA